MARMLNITDEKKKATSYTFKKIPPKTYSDQKSFPSNLVSKV